MAEVNLGRIGFVNKGSWNSSVDYKINDVVKYGGSTYVAKRPNTGITPPTDGTNTDDWFYFVNNSDYVDKTSNQEVTGVKNFTNGIATTEIIGETIFTESPLVPTPTTEYQVATKKYVDDKTIINTLPDKPTPDDTDNLALQETGGLLKKLSFANLTSWVKSFSFGWGQTWQNVTADRNIGVVYTNNTNKPIIVLLGANWGNTSSFKVNNETVTLHTPSVSTVATFTIGVGSSYIHNAPAPNNIKWLELR